jgi:hypothetical protein
MSKLAAVKVTGNIGQKEPFREQLCVSSQVNISVAGPLWTKGQV